MTLPVVDPVDLLVRRTSWRLKPLLPACPSSRLLMDTSSGAGKLSVPLRGKTPQSKTGKSCVYLRRYSTRLCKTLQRWRPLGKPSGWLVDVDLDEPLASHLAPAFLPSTGAVFGRKGKPASHWLYRCEGAKTKKWMLNKQVSLAVLGEGREAMLLELRSTGCQTIFPPSIHPSCEEITWHSKGEPAQVSKINLERACAKLACATLLTLAWPEEGTRQETAWL